MSAEFGLKSRVEDVDENPRDRACQRERQTWC